MPELYSQRQRLFSKRRQTNKRGLAARRCPPPTSAYITTSRLLSQIASQGEYGIIPRFIGEKLTFLFWNRERDGRIVGCEISAPAFRERVAAALPST